MSPLSRTQVWTLVCGLLVGMAAAHAVAARQDTQRFGGNYASLDARRQQLVSDWVRRFNDAAGQKVTPETFYDAHVSLSSKTTFDAVTNALMTTPLTGESGERIGDALDLIEQLETVRGMVRGASGDRQFRIYARLKPNAVDMLEQSREFRRGVDNAIFHQGFPTNYRQQGGSPSIQVSIAADRRRADIDVDYRGSTFPVSMFNGHLTSSNSDVRAGNNYDRHNNRWNGFQNWWRNVFGIRVPQSPEDLANDGSSAVTAPPRAGNKDIDVMMRDFMQAWLIDGDVRAAAAYVSERAYPCLADDPDNAADIDRGVAPFVLRRRLQIAYDALGSPTSLEGLSLGVRLATPALKLVQQPHHAQFVLYSVPDDVAATFDCESRAASGARPARRAYGNYFGATFTIVMRGERGIPLALLWAKDDGYWKIVSWQIDPDGDTLPPPPPPAAVKIATIKTDATLATAATDFLESWLIRKNYDAAFQYASRQSYSCYDLLRAPDQPAATSLDDAGRKIRAGLESTGKLVGPARNLEDLLMPVPPLLPSIQAMLHPHSDAFSLSSFPNALIEAVDCSARARGVRPPSTVPLEYGRGFGMTFRFRSAAGETPVMRALWIKEGAAWRIASYDIELP